MHPSGILKLVRQHYPGKGCNSEVMTEIMKAYEKLLCTSARQKYNAELLISGTIDGIVLYCIVLYCIVLHLYCIVLYCIVLYCVVL